MPLLEGSILFEVQFCLKFSFEVQFYCFILDCNVVYLYLLYIFFQAALMIQSS